MERVPSEPKGKEPLSLAADGRASDTENTFSEPFMNGRTGRGQAMSRGCHGSVSQPPDIHPAPSRLGLPREACGPGTPAVAAALSAEPAVSFLCFLCSRQSNPLPEGSFPSVVLSALELNTGPARSASHTSPATGITGFMRTHCNAAHRHQQRAAQELPAGAAKELSPYWGTGQDTDSSHLQGDSNPLASTPHPLPLSEGHTGVGLLAGLLWPP